ncbi:Cfap46 [Columba guinea]|nr:Cfap46 [Columba guinea]
MEIARIEEDGDTIEAAMEHLQKALHLNNGGQYEEYLRLSLKRLQLRTMLYKSPERLEDRAALLIEQAKRGKQEDDVRKKRALLINAGLALAPDSFKVVLDSENEAKGAFQQCWRGLMKCIYPRKLLRSPVVIQVHVIRCLRKQKEGGLWVALYEARVVTLFTLVLFVAQKKKAGATLEDEEGDSSPRQPLLPDKSFSFERDLLRILAEIRFINGEATVQLLRLQGAELNGRAEPPEGGRQGPRPPESDPEWKTYSLWIDHLSRYAMENFQRAAEIGEELKEAWIVHNAAVYVLNYNRHLISAGRQRDIIADLQTLLGAIRSVGQNGSTVVLLMLCNAVARGLILRWIPKPEPAEEKEEAADRSRKASEKNHERADIIQSCSVDPRGLPDIKAALENNDEAQDATARLLVGLEMYSCNGLGLMDFTVPSLSQLVKLALECSWSDSLVELQTLTRLVYFGYVSRDHETVMTCSRRMLQSDECFHNRDAKKHEMPGHRARQEMLSAAACIQGKSIMQNWRGRKRLRVAAAKAFVQSARYAGEAGNYSLAMFAARHFWNTCVPLLGSPRDRGQLEEPTDTILKSIIKAQSKNEQVRMSNRRREICCLCISGSQRIFRVLGYRLDAFSQVLIFKHMATVKAGLGGSVAMDIQKFGGVGEDCLSRMWRCLVLVSRSAVAQLSCFQNAIMTLQKQENEWQKVDYLMEFAEWLYCNQFPLHDVIKPLDWVVDLLLHMEFSVQSSQGGKNHIPEFSPRENVKVNIGANDTRRQINLEDLSNIRQLEALFRAQTLLALVAGPSSPLHPRCCLMAYACIIRVWQVSLSAARSIIKVSSKSSQLTAPQKVESIIAPEKDEKKKEKGKKKDKQVEVSVVKEKPRGTGWGDTLPVSVEEWARYDCPSTIRDAFKQKTNSYGINWDNFPKPTCTLYFMDLLSNELQKMFCPHLILPVFQLAEVIANDVVECASLSGLYHLRIALICSDLKLSQASLYHEKAAGEAHISGLEQAMYVLRCRQEIALKKEKEVHTRAEERKRCFENAQLNGSRVENVLASSAKGFELNAVTGKGLSALSFPYLWTEKAQVLIQLGLYQPARLLLSEAHAAAQELGAPREAARCLRGLAALAALEQHHGQARALLEAAQRRGGHERFWGDSGLALAEAVLEQGGPGAPSAACEILERTASVLRSAFLKRPNRQPELGFIIASLEARVIAKQGRNEEAKHSRYLDAYNLAQRAVSETEEVFRDVSSLFAANETAGISIPLMRELADRKLNLVEILLDIFRLVIAEKKLKEEREASCLGVAEAFLRAAAGDAAAQQDWKRMERTVGHIALAQLANVQSLCKGCPDTTSKCLYLTGKTLRLLAVSTDPVHSDVYWKPNAMKEHRLAEKYLSQCSEALLRCVNVAFRHNVTDVLAPASLEMVECFQQFDPVSTSQFLALHQSCSVSLRMKSVLLAAAPDTSSSQLAALLHLQRQLTHARSTSDLLARVEQHLTATSVAWRNLCIPVEHFNIMDELPSNFYIMILQHSEDRSHLYSSLIGKPGAAAAQQKGRPAGPGVRAKVSRFPVNPDTFCALLEKVHLYKQQQMQSQLEQTVIQNLQECTFRTDVTPPEKIHDNGHDLTSDFSEILEIMEDYLKPVLSQVDFSDTREQDTSASAAGSGKAKVKDKDPRQTRMQGAAADFGLCVILLGDTSLLELPLEALRIFKAEGISSVSRDFSLQILYNRMHMAESETDVKTDVEKSKENKPKAHQKKNGKKAPVNRDLPSNCLSVDTRHLKYIVDPYNEGREAEALSPSQKLKEILEKHGELQWRGAAGSERLPSQAEWEQLLATCSAFLFYGTERFLSHVVLDRLVAMNIPQCHLMILLDLVRTKESYHRIINSGSHKSLDLFSGAQAAVESPAGSAMLLSLAGVRSVLANQWYTTLRDNAERLDVLAENLLSFGRTTGQIVRILQKRKIHRETDSIKTGSVRKMKEYDQKCPYGLTALLYQKALMKS